MKNKHILVVSIFVSPLFGFQSVDINQANSEQIALLPGVGIRLAENIISFRKKNGPLSNAEQMREITGMTDKKLEGLKDKILFKGLKSPKPEAIKTEPKPKMPIKPIVNWHELEARVLKVFGLTDELERSLSHRVRKAAYLPKLAANFDIDQGNTITERFLSEKDYQQKRDGRNFSFGIRAIFDLDRLVYNSDELDVAKLMLERMKKREEVINKLHRLYFRYKTLLETDPTSLEIREIEAMLDSMSQGFFTKIQSEMRP